MVKFYNTKFILFSILILFSSQLLSQNFYKQGAGVIEEYTLNDNDPENNRDVMITWFTDQAHSIPYYFYNWTTNDLPEELDPSTCQSEIEASMLEWHEESDVFDFEETDYESNEHSLGLKFSDNITNFADPYNVGGATASAVQYDGNTGKYKFTYYTQWPVNQGYYRPYILFNNTSAFYSAYYGRKWTDEFEELEAYQVCFRQVALHELGHVIGLAHCYNDYQAVMYPSIKQGVGYTGIQDPERESLAILNVMTPTCEHCPPATPVNLSATIIGQNVILTWNAYPQDGGAWGLQIVKNGQIFGSPLDITETSFIDNNGINYLPATYEIYAFNEHGASYSHLINIKIAQSTISSNILWNDVVYVNSNITINPTGNLVIGDNTKVIFNAGHGYNITVSGKISSEGLPYGQVLITSNSTNPAVNDWGSIFLSGSGSSGSKIKYTNIQYGNGIQVINVPDFEISNCNFLNNYISIYCNGSIGSILNNYLSSNSIGHSIQLNLSTVTCNKNKIKKIDSGAKRGHGILFGGGSHGSAWQNDIYNVDWGIGSIWSSSVDCYNSNYYNEPNDERNNRITNCNYGVRIYNNSYPILGRPISVYGYSTIKNNSVDVSLNTDNITASNLEAYEIYWNNGDYSHAIVQKGNGSNIIHAPEATSDQWQNIPFPKIQSPPNMKSNNAIASIDANSNSDKASNVSKESSSVEVFDSLFTGINLRHQKKLIEAKDYFISYLSKHPEDQRAYTELYNCEDKQTIKEILTFFKTLPKQASKEQGLLLSYLYQKEGDIQSAKKINNALIKKYPNTPLSARANIENMYILLYSENNLNDAVDIFKDVLKEAQLSTSTELKDAEYALESYARIHEKPIPDFDALKKALSSAINQNEEFSLLGNYPNPFNPSTTISYNLPRTSNVEIIVYDILGNKIKSFNISSQNAGKQHVVWNGTNGNNQQVASGIYLYHFKAMSLEGKNEIFEKTAKLLLLK